MQVVYRRCAGLDVHKDRITATILVFPEKGKRGVRTQEFRTCWKDLQRLAQWLRSSTGWRGWTGNWEYACSRLRRR